MNSFTFLNVNIYELQKRFYFDVYSDIYNTQFENEVKFLLIYLSIINSSPVVVIES